MSTIIYETVQCSRSGYASSHMIPASETSNFTSPTGQTPSVENVTKL